MEEENRIPNELPKMPTGDIPADIRKAAEEYVEKAIVIDELSEELKVKRDLVITLLNREHLTAVAVIIGDSRFKITYDSGSPRLKVKEIKNAD